MSAKKTKPASSPGLFSTVKTAVWRGRWLLAIVVVLAVVGVGWRLIWNRVGDRVISDGDYHLNPQDIVISPLPPWIHADFKKDVIRDASLEESLSILDDDLAKRVANAFSMHPWVAKVHRVSKHHPACVEVELSYRQPVAMVEVGGGVLAVDAEGTCLPSKEFLLAPAEAAKYPRISRIDTSPDIEGKNWGDPNVAGAAQIAAVLGGRWQKLKLFRVLAPVRESGIRDSLVAGLPTPPPVDRYTFELSTKAGTRIIWGRPPGNEPTGEAPALAKVRLLEQIAAQHGSLDKIGSPIDLRTGDAAAARTAAKPPAGS